MRVLFIGTGEIGAPTLQRLAAAEEHELVGVVTQPDKPAGRNQQLEAPPIKKTLARTRLPILQPPRIKDPHAIAEIRALGPEIVVVMAYGQILPRELLEVPPIACLNLHASLLPRWRGAAPIQAAIVAGDRQTGVTVMYMDEGLDTGDILLSRSIDILPSDTGGSLHDRIGLIAPEALMEALRLFSGNSAPRIPQDAALATYAPKLKRDAGKLDWSQPADAIERKIRGFNPWPGAFTTVAEKADEPRNLKIFSALTLDFSGAPGEIVSSDRRGFVVAAGSGALSLQEVQLEGKRRMSAAELIRGHPWIAKAALR